MHQPLLTLNILQIFVTLPKGGDIVNGAKVDHNYIIKNGKDKQNFAKCGTRCSMKVLPFNISQS